MIENSADFLHIWMLLSAAFGFIIGDDFGDSTRHRKCLQQINDDLREEFEKAPAFEEPLHRELHRQRGVINDIHKQIELRIQPPNCSRYCAMYATSFLGFGPLPSRKRRRSSLPLKPFARGQRESSIALGMTQLSCAAAFSALQSARSGLVASYSRLSWRPSRAPRVLREAAVSST